MIKKSLYNVIYRLANLLFPLITSAYVARVLMESGVGRVAFAQNNASYFVTFASMGMADYGLREIARVRDDHKKMDQVFTQLMVINLVLTGVSAFFYLLFCILIKNYFLDEKLLMVCGLAVAFNTINVEWFYRGNEEYEYIAVRSILLKLLLLGAVFVFVRDVQDYVIYALLVCLATGGNYVFNLFHLRKKVRIDFSGFEIHRHVSPLVMISLCALLGTIYSKTDVTMLGLMEDEASVAYYTYAHKTIDVVITCSIAITSVFLPRLSYEYHNNRERFDRLLSMGICIVTFFSVPACFGIALLAPEVIALLYGENFIPAVTALRIFAILALVKSFGDLLCYQLALCTGNEKSRLPAYFLAAIANIILNLWMIPRWSFAGAAIASVLSEIIVNGYQLVKMKKKVFFSIDKKAVSQAFFSSVIMSIAVLIIKYSSLKITFKCVAAVILGGVVYTIVNILMRNQLVLIAIEKLVKRSEK